MQYRVIFMAIIVFVLALPSHDALAIRSKSPLVQQPLTAETAEAFVDKFMQEQMPVLHVPGAAIVIVQHDGLLFQQGYGMADLARQMPVDVNETLFRAGSISKLFTATAVMQLVERGAIDLEADVNEYLKRLQLPQRFDRPVTVADLLLHTAGFDEVFFGVHVREAGELQPLADFLGEHLPERYLPPGEFISYNDHGYTVAGLLVEEVSGLPFDQYVATHILEPLQMTESTFTQPLPKERLAEMAVGYRYDGERYQPYALDYVQVSPSAGLIAPAGEMANFMLAHLNGGSFAGQPILQPATVASMQQRHFAHHPALRGRGYGFAEWQENGRRAVFHDGGNPGFLSRLFLLPEERVGFYLTFNSDQYTDAARFHRAFTTDFLDTFFPPTDDEPIASAIVAPDRPLAEFAGYYREVQGYSHDTLQKIDSLMNQFPVSADTTQLSVFGRSYDPIGMLVFQNAAAESTVVFRADDQGAITHLFVGTGAYAKVPWYESQPVQLGFLIWFLLIFAAAIVGGIGWRRAPALLRISLVAVGLLNLVFLLGLAAILLQLDRWEFSFGLPAIVQMLLVLPLISFVPALLLVGFATVVRRRIQWVWGTRLYLFIVMLTAVAFPLFLNFWNLLGFRY